MSMEDYNQRREEEKRLEADKFAQLVKLAKATIAELNTQAGTAYALDVERTNDCGHHRGVCFRDGMKRLDVRYHNDHYQGKTPTHLHISADLPDGPSQTFGKDYLPYEERQGYKGLDINAATVKGAARIAADVKRRLLPEYDRLVPMVLEGIERRQREIDATASNLERLAAAAGVTLRDNDRRDHQFFLPSHIKAYGIVRVSDASVSFERLSSITIVRAEAILKVLTAKGGE